VRLGTRARWGLALAAALALGACRQTVVLDSPPLDAGDPAGAAGAAGATPTGTGGADASSDNDAAMDTGAGGRPDGTLFCDGGQFQSLSLTLQSPQVIFAVDRSSVMQSMFGDQTRLQVVQGLVEALVTKYDRTIHFGYEEYPSSTSTCGGSPGGGMSCGNGPGAMQGCCAGDATLFAFNGVNALTNLLKVCDGNGNNGACSQSQRPIADALTHCEHTFSLLNDSSHDRYVILITGGDPTCMSSDATSTPCDDAVAEATKLNLASVVTTVFAVGGDATTSPCLDRLATAGGPTGGASPLYHLALTPTQLSDELSPVVQSMAEEACHIDLRLAPTDPNNVYLLLDNVVVPIDGVDGWSFDSGTSPDKITVHGSWCDKLLQSMRVELVSGCMPHK
jgi:hypothetical protein